MKVIQLMAMAVSVLSATAYACPNNPNEICTDDTVLYGNSIRSVEAVIDSGRVVLRETFHYYRSFAEVGSLSLVVPFYNGYASGRRVLYGNSIRVIQAVDNTGRVVLEETSQYYQTFTDDSSISKLVKCYGKVCRGDEVLYGNAIRTIEAVDNTGRIVLAEDNSYYQSFANQSAISVLKHCTD